ncbi:hypothetical protein CDJ04_13940 [Salmonella enterica]|nr:hypothetical protein [Salmonella enterica]EBZ5138241.1 hypothetical protein [Salmonella enterica subsp. enterica serovar Antsalova]ECS6899732.1 hypothetical protein [Salmonella enterica]
MILDRLSWYFFKYIIALALLISQSASASSSSPPDQMCGLFLKTVSVTFSLILPPNRCIVAGLSLRRMVNLTTRRHIGYKWRKTRHTCRRAISRIATTGSALSQWI